VKRFEKLYESQWTSIRLSEREAEELTLLGRRLAAEEEWWGARDDSEAAERTVIDCRKRPGGNWSVFVREAIGLVGIGDLQISVHPKIPTAHFIFLAEQSARIPRSDSQPTHTDQAVEFADLIIRWFLAATEKLLRAELSRGYVEVQGELDCVRGRLLPLETARQYYAGRPVAICDFEEFNEDTPLNRVIRSAAEVVASGVWVSPELRRRAKAILARMDAVGPLLASDMRVTVDRLTNRYKDSLTFAKYVISRAGTHISHGSRAAWSFLIRTPELIEDGIREVLSTGLAPAWVVRKQRRAMRGAPFTLNPDIVVADGEFVADVKYKMAAGEWTRPDVYQVVTFATGFRSRGAALIYFDDGGAVHVPTLTIGALPIAHLKWNASADVSPIDAARHLVADFGMSLEACGCTPASTRSRTEAA
jgi:hypothetical protein